MDTTFGSLPRSTEDLLQKWPSYDLDVHYLYQMVDTNALREILAANSDVLLFAGCDHTNSLVDYLRTLTMTTICHQ